MTEFDVDLRLDEDFLFILSFSKDFMNSLAERPEENMLAQNWLSKLCCEVVDGICAKRLRNTYLVRLLSCLQAGKLTDPFLEQPSSGPLSPLPVLELDEKEPPWLKEIMDENKNAGIPSKAPDGRSYLSTKVFEQNRGACAYVAVSVADEGEVPHWVQLGTAKQFECHLEQIFTNMAEKPVVRDPCDPPETKVKKEKLSDKAKAYFNYVIQSIRAERGGQIAPRSNRELNMLIERFIRYVENSGVTCEARKLPISKQRQYYMMKLERVLRDQLK